MQPAANFELAVRLRHEGLPLGDAFAFISGLYFRGKLAYARSFASPPQGAPGALVITSGHGLLPPETIISIDDLQHMASIPIDAGDPRYREPLQDACRQLDRSAGPDCEFILLGSVATPKYIEPIFEVFGDRLLFPEEFVGRGDMSRGGLMLRCVSARTELTCGPLGGATRHGKRPSTLPKNAGTGGRVPA